ncbi:winged helix-turn-helix domain-containing protein [Paenochrobactrum sp. BZR 588]|uniref:winged helix-turn-helix domain-containing protein n=1 Tax=Paenochrobactrum TaxID=999488 RepID=UPI0035BC55FB
MSGIVLKPIIRIDVSNDLGQAQRIGRGKIQLLELIKETGSISSAGRAMNMSYRRAWMLVNAMNTMFSKLVVDSQRGGKHGGGAIVTPFGEELIAQFRIMEQQLALAIEPQMLWLRENLNETLNTAQD